MTGNVPPDLGGGSAGGPPREPWTTHPARIAPRSRTWPVIALAVIAAGAAVAALVVALTNSKSATPTAAATPPYTAAQTAAAQQQLCDTYKVAARAVQVDANGNNPAFARIALTNSAVMVDNAASDPALDAKHRDAARALATAYLVQTAKSNSDAFPDAEFRTALDDVIAKDALMKQVCGGG
jgi:hypothetical protein